MNNTSPFDLPEKTTDEVFLDTVAADLECLIKEGAKVEECVIIVDAVGDFQVLHLPMITVAPEVTRLAKVPMIVMNNKFLLGHSGIISLNLSSF